MTDFGDRQKHIEPRLRIIRDALRSNTGLTEEREHLNNTGDCASDEGGEQTACIRGALVLDTIAGGSWMLVLLRVTRSEWQF